jgi:plastocyanin
MRRALGALGVLIVAAAVATAMPAGSGAASSAVPSATHRCKHKHHHHKKRCRKKRTGTSTVTGTPGGSGGPPGRLLATERELSASQLQLQLSRATLAAGTTIVEQYNAGSDPHNLILERKGQVAFSFNTLDPGGNQRQTLNLARGTWTLYCSLLDHRELGMQATLTVN